MTQDAVRELLRITDWGVFAYFVALNSSYLILICLAGLEFARHLRRIPFVGADDMFRSPLTLPVSVIVPAYMVKVMCTWRQTLAVWPVGSAGGRGGPVVLASSMH